MRAAHFLIILCFLTMLTVGLHSPRPEAPLNNPPPFFCCLTLFHVFFRVGRCGALGRQITVEHTSSFHLFTNLCRARLTVLGGFVWSWADTHISLGRRPQGTPANSCSWSSGFSRQGRRSYQCYSVCVCQ